MIEINFDVLYVELTHFCNQSCKHCYLNCGMDRELYPMSTAEIKKMIDDFKNQGGAFITLTGGEPFARKDIFDILDHVEAAKLNFIVATNGLLMTEERVKKLASYNHLYSVHTSILGGCEEDHNYISNSNGYLSAVRGIELFHKYGVHAYIQITLSKKFINSTMKIADEFKDFDCTLKFTPIADIGVKGDKGLFDELVLGEEDYKEFLNEYNSVKKKYGDKIDRHNLMRYDELKKEVENNLKHELYGIEDAMLIVRPNGDKTFSFGIDNYKSFGNVADGIEIAVDDKLRDFAEKKKEIDKEILNKYDEGDFINYEFVSESLMARR